MMLYTPSESESDSQHDSRRSSSFVIECIVPVGVIGCAIAYFVTRVGPDELHATISQCVVFTTVCLVTAGLLNEKWSFAALRQAGTLRQQGGQTIG